MTYIRTAALSLMLLTAVSLPCTSQAASVSDLIAQLTAIQAELVKLKNSQVLGASVSFDEPMVLPGETTDDSSSTAPQTKTSTDQPLVLPGESEVRLHVEMLDTYAHVEEDSLLGDYTIDLELTAEGGDAYVPKTVSLKARSGFDVAVIPANGKGVVSGAVDTNAPEDGDYFVIYEGETEDFSVNVWYDPDVAGDYAVRLQAINYATEEGGALTALVPPVKKATTERVYLRNESDPERTVIEVQSVTMSESTAGQSTGVFKMGFDVTAVDGDAYFYASSTAYQFVVKGPSVTSLTSVMTSHAPLVNGQFVVEEGETEYFTLTVSATAGKTGNYSAQLKGLTYASAPNGARVDYTIPTAWGSDFTTDKIRLVTGTTTSSVKGTFTKKTLSTKTANPTIKGTASGTDAVGFWIGNGDKVYGSGRIVVKNGKWSHQITEDIRSGAYTIVLSDYATNKELTRATLNVKDPNEAYSATMSVVVGVYEGRYATPRAFRTHPEGTVTVTLTADESEYAQPLVLSAYEPVNWVISRPARARISKVITVGYYDQRVTGLPADVPVEHYSVVGGDTAPYAYESGTQFNSLVKWLKKEHELDYSGVFYNSYTTPSFNVEWGYKG